jgi:hypothetical protein
VTDYDNPAGRLLFVLSRLKEASSGGISLVAAWAQVFGVAEDDVVLRLGAINDLVSKVQDEVDRTAPAFEPLVVRYRSDWSKPIFPVDRAFNTPGSKSMPGVPALEALAAISAHLHGVGPDGQIPTENQLADLKEQLEELRDDVRECAELPDELKHEIAARLADISQALEHVHIGGPQAVRRAMEALVGSVAFRDPEGTVWSKPVLRKLTTVLVAGYMAFTAGPEIERSIESWTNILRGELTSGSPSVAPEAEHEAEVVEETDLNADATESP